MATSSPHMKNVQTEEGRNGYSNQFRNHYPPSTKLCITPVRQDFTYNWTVPFFPINGGQPKVIPYPHLNLNGTTHGSSIGNISHPLSVPLPWSPSMKNPSSTSIKLYGDPHDALKNHPSRSNGVIQPPKGSIRMPEPAHTRRAIPTSPPITNGPKFGSLISNSILSQAPLANSINATSLISSYGLNPIAAVPSLANPIDLSSKQCDLTSSHNAISVQPRHYQRHHNPNSLLLPQIPHAIKTDVIKSRQQEPTAKVHNYKKLLKNKWFSSNETSNPDTSCSGSVTPDFIDDSSSQGSKPYDAISLFNLQTITNTKIITNVEAKKKRKSEDSNKASPGKKPKPCKQADQSKYSKADHNSSHIEESSDACSSTPSGKRGRKPKKRYDDEEVEYPVKASAKKVNKDASKKSLIQNGKSEPDEDEASSEGKSKESESNGVIKARPKVKKILGPTKLQDRSCFEEPETEPRCRECRISLGPQKRSQNKNFCRFYHYRKVRETKKGTYAPVGFCQPDEAEEADINIWLPSKSKEAQQDLDVDTCKYLLKFVGDQFCDLVCQEKEAVKLHKPGEKNRTWKKLVQDVREMCDVCETTLFNNHWVCKKCGFVVCIDCFKARQNGTAEKDPHPPKDQDQFHWLHCSKEIAHEPKELYLTQIIPKDCLSEVSDLVHSVRSKLNIPQNCSCQNKPPPSNSIIPIIETSSEVKRNSLTNFIVDGHSSPLDWLAHVALQDAKDTNLASSAFETSSIDDQTGSSITSSSCLRGLLTKNGVNGESLIDHCLPKESRHPSQSESNKENSQNLEHYTPSYRPVRTGYDHPPMSWTKEETERKYPNVPHTLYCDGRLLVLEQPDHEENVHLFQEQWKRAQPVLVKNVHDRLDQKLWSPSIISVEMSEERVAFVNCITGSISKRQKMGKFWQGFECLGNRNKDAEQENEGKPNILKVKDWPENDDFNEKMPDHFQDLMKGLPLVEYTARNGKLNLASRLPKDFLRPDLGPKFYIAYGTPSYPHKATTNLHLDISDAINVIVYVGIPTDDELSEEKRIEQNMDVAKEAGCDSEMIERLKDPSIKLGAIWHIYDPRDSNKIRDLLNKVAREQGKQLEPNHDPIHDQDCYLNKGLRLRLETEYQVKGYAIAQCLGDAIMIPAGAPHQVRNINSCIKVAGDYVSPENITHCFNLTQEFRQLSSSHHNHPDKLQIKNMIYHAVKDAVGILSSSLET